MASHKRYIPSAFSGCFFILLVSVALNDSAYAANDYTTSAHGDLTIGVKRTATELTNYSRGNCAHCHEQHASINGSEPVPTGGAASTFELFADTNPTVQTTNFCFNCHKASGAVQTGGGITNYNYYTNFGGGPVGTTSMYDAFNAATGSSHSLNAISTYIQLPAQAAWKFSAYTNPCNACHNPHRAKKNDLTGVSYDATQAAISRPADHSNLWGTDDPTKHLWGDSAAERIDQNVGVNTYRAPFFVGADPASDPTLHEPDGLSNTIASANVKGSTTPDYNTFCLDCHVNAVGAYNAIDWTSGSSDQHGFVNGNTVNGGPGGGGGTLSPPYTLNGTSGTGEDLGTNFVLSCLDCHEPHGSQGANNAYLLRTTVNGVSGITFAAPDSLGRFCVACHATTGHSFGLDASCDLTKCHAHGLRF